MNTGDRGANLEQYQKRLEAQRRQKAQQLADQQQRNEVLRQEFIKEFGHELLALIEGDPRAKAFVTQVVEKLVFRDERSR